MKTFRLSHSWQHERGFTLIELMIVIAIIGILATIAITQFSFFSTKSFNKSAVADLRSAATAQEAYFVDNGTYSLAIGPITGSTYGFYPTDGVNPAVLAASVTGYTMTAYHNSGTVTYTLAGPGGTINP